MTESSYELPAPFGDYSGSPPDSDVVDAFRRIVYEYYGEFGRDLPWRSTSDPYEILVSEIMLQQTQVSRVLPKYGRFLSLWPTVNDLASASLRDVLAVWKGLGYNRRGRALWEIAGIVEAQHAGSIPRSVDELRRLPMIGTATASAICAFACGAEVVFLETNIRRVFLFFFFQDRASVHDRSILSIVESTLDRGDPRNWYYALMDFGVFLKKRVVNPNVRSAHYVRQAPFENSDRQVRGRILEALLESDSADVEELTASLPFERERIVYCLDRLAEEGMVCERVGRYEIPEK